MQTANTVLMVEPIAFGYNSQTAQNNYFQVEQKEADIQEKALQEFNNFVEKLREKGIQVITIKDTLEPHSPDSIFPNNWVSFHEDGRVALYPMFAMNRRVERRSDILDTLRDEGFNITEVNDFSNSEKDEKFLEGTGSMIFDRDKRIAYCCRSPRSSEKVLQDFCSRMNFDAVVFDSFDKNGNLIYHTNVMMEVGTQVAVVCLESIKDEKEREKVASRLTATGKIIVDISLDQANHFAGNMLELKSRNGKPLMIMSAAARESLTPHQETIISTYNKILSPELNTIETNGGGSARCMIAEIFY